MLTSLSVLAELAVLFVLTKLAGGGVGHVYVGLNLFEPISIRSSQQDSTHSTTTTGRPGLERPGCV